MTELVCTCYPSLTTGMYETTDCEIHKVGGLRDDEARWREIMFSQWKKQHPIRNVVRKIELRLRYRKMFRNTKWRDL